VVPVAAKPPGSWPADGVREVRRHQPAVTAVAGSHHPDLARPERGRSPSGQGPDGRKGGWSGQGSQGLARLFYTTQFSTVSPGTAVRSLSADTTVQFPSDRAMAARRISAVCIGRPIRRSSAASRPCSSAAARSNGQQTILLSPLVNRRRVSSWVELKSIP